MMTPSQKKREDLEISKNPRLAKNFNKGFIDHKKKVSKDIVRYRVPSAINKTGNYSNLGKKIQISQDILMVYFIPIIKMLLTNLI